jgi:hypothetical protein
MKDDLTDQLADLRVDTPSISQDLGDVERRAVRIRGRRRATQGAAVLVALLVIAGGVVLRELGDRSAVNLGPADRPGGATGPTTERPGDSGPGALALRQFPDGSWVAVTSHRAVVKPNGSINCLAESLVVQGLMVGADQIAVASVVNAWGEPPWVAPLVLSGSDWSWPIVVVVGVHGRFRAVFSDGVVDEVEVTNPHAVLVGRPVAEGPPPSLQTVERLNPDGTATPMRLGTAHPPAACGPDSYPGGRSATAEQAAAADEVIRRVFGPRGGTSETAEPVTGLVEPPADDLLDAFTRGPWMPPEWTVETGSHRVTEDGHLWVRVHLPGLPVVEQPTGVTSDRWVELVPTGGGWKVTRRSVCEMVSSVGVQCSG